MYDENDVMISFLGTKTNSKSYRMVYIAGLKKSDLKSQFYQTCFIFYKKWFFSKNIIDIFGKIYYNIWKVDIIL